MDRQEIIESIYNGDKPLFSDLVNVAYKEVYKTNKYFNWAKDVEYEIQKRIVIDNNNVVDDTRASVFEILHEKDYKFKRISDYSLLVYDMTTEQEKIIDKGNLKLKIYNYSMFCIYLFLSTQYLIGINNVYNSIGEEYDLVWAFVGIAWYAICGMILHLIYDMIKDKIVDKVRNEMKGVYYGNR